MSTIPSRRLVRLVGLPMVAGFLAVGCAEEDRADAYGTFEADEVTVSAEAPGRLLQFSAREGSRLEAGERVAVSDTTQAVLRLREASARRRAAAERVRRARRELQALQARLETAREELARDRRLLRDSAATPRQVNLRRREVRVLERQVGAARSARQAALEERKALAAREEQLLQRLRDESVIRNPVAGVVLVTYANEGEFVRVGQPLYEVARLDTLTLTAFVSGSQLAEIRLGQEVTVRYDSAAGRRAARTGRITRIADEAEFTPTPILTREERVDFVYEVEVAVPNPDGVLKIGMPGEVEFTRNTDA